MLRFGLVSSLLAITLISGCGKSFEKNLVSNGGDPQALDAFSADDLQNGARDAPMLGTQVLYAPGGYTYPGTLRQFLTSGPNGVEDDSHTGVFYRNPSNREYWRFTAMANDPTGSRMTYHISSNQGMCDGDVRVSGDFLIFETRFASWPQSAPLGWLLNYRPCRNVTNFAVRMTSVASWTGVLNNGTIYTYMYRAR